ncbi:MAG TPA: tetratricopeptide repeat protein [Gemmatimonadaceae bacterium]|nr:tetratricopeptide repeat protein [Gemmatimonadaceae bacterium]
MTTSTDRNGRTPDVPVAHGSADRWVMLEALFQEALTLPVEERSAHLRSICPDAGACQEVEALLAAHERRGRLDELADEVMAPLLARREAPTPSSAAPSMHPRYRMLERLGGGGMGVVFRARDERLARDVALKFLAPHLSADRAAKKRFLVEARAAAALEHPNICTVHEIGDTDDGQLYIVMTCYEGETLDRRIERGPLVLADALRIGVDIARGLVQAHDRGIVHRDIKPANVMLTSDGLVKVLDFGIAKLADSSTTQVGVAVGTVAYMSPEQAFGEAVDHRSDIWSLGVVLYEMLAGVRPFGGAGDQAMIFAALTTEPEPIANLRPDVPSDVHALVRRALQKRPDDRFLDAGEMLSALEACLARAASSAGARGLAPTRGDRTGVDRASGATLARGSQRRQVTVVDSRPAGHAELLELLPPEDADRLLLRVKQAATAAASEHGGIMNQFSGDGIIMIFGAAAAREDDAACGVRAALALHARLAEIARSMDGRVAVALRMRSGVHVGAVVAQRLLDGGRRFRITGTATDVAGRLAAAAAPDTILVSPETRRLVAAVVQTEEASALALHPDDVPVVVHRVTGLSDSRAGFERPSTAVLTPFVGREHERAALGEQLTSAREGAGRLTVLVGEAGAGKSRLLHELRDRAVENDVRVLVGRCDAYGGTTPFLPFVDAVHDALGLESGVMSVRPDSVESALEAIDPSLTEFLPLYFALLGITSDSHPLPPHLIGERLQAVMLDAIAALFTLGARGTPTVLLLEDWHWADEGSRAALRQLAEIIPAFPLLVVVTSRPEREVEWGSADQHTLMHLGPLDVASAEAIACAAFQADRVAPELTAQLYDRTGGNPFFLEELCAALREQGSVVLRDGVGALVDVTETGTMQVPQTVQGVLRTRIDRLDDEALQTLRVASVIGRVFSRGVLADVAAEGDGLAPAMERLKASGLVQQVGVLPEPTYRFKHALTREVAYDSLLEHQRATLHRSVGEAMEQRHAMHLDEHVERLAHHFGRAEDWPRAVRYGLMAADRAMGLSQNGDALSTLEQVEAWAANLPDDADRRDLQADVLLRQERLCEMLGLRKRQLDLVERLTTLLAPSGPSERLAQVYLRQGDAFTLLHRFESAERSLQTALGISAERDDAAGARNAMRSIALLRVHEGRREEALAQIERVIELGREAGDRRAESADLATLANILRVMGQPERALAVLQAALENTSATDNPVRHGALLNVIGTVHRELGDDEKALEYFHRVASEGLEQRHPVNASFTIPAIAHILLGQGRVEESLEMYGRAVDMNRKARYADGLAHACRSLGEVLLGIDRPAEAIPPLREAAALFAQLEDAANEMLMWRRVATAQERLSAPDQARTAWSRVRELHMQTSGGDDDAEALEGLARAARRLGGAGEDVMARYQDALALAIRTGDRRRELAVRNSLGIVHWQQGEYADAVRQYEAALRVCREEHDRVHEALILNSLGATLHRLRRWDEARTALLAGERVAAESGELRLRAHALATLGEVCLASGRLDDALAHLDASLELRRALADRRGEGWMHEAVARVFAARGAPQDARASADAAMVIAQELDDVQLREAAQRLLVPAGRATSSTT